MKIVSHRQKVNFVLDKKKLFHELHHEGFANMSGLQSFLEKKAGAGITLTTVIIIVFMIIINREELIGVGEEKGDKNRRAAVFYFDKVDFSVKSSGK